MAPNIGQRTGYLAGADEERVAGLGSLLDSDVDVILAARGGYGITRILPGLPWKELARWGGWLVGFSDVTALHAAAGSRFPRATLHGPMGTTLARHGPSSERLFAWWRGTAPRSLFRLSPGQVLRAGSARGVAVGGNLSVLAALVGTAYEPDYSGAVLFVEDVGEPLYRLDRLLTQLRQSSRLATVKAVIAGRLASCGRGEVGWRERWRSLLAEAAPPTAVVLEGLPFGHGAANTPVPLGVEVAVDTAVGEITLGGE